jgi:hypothetical protein
MPSISGKQKNGLPGNNPSGLYILSVIAATGLACFFKVLLKTDNYGNVINPAPFITA